MPEFAAGRWLNSSNPVRKADLHGFVSLIDFWDYSCVNCLRTLPYLRHWHARYAEHGLRIIGVHAPEFRFGRSAAQLQSFLERTDIRYPVLLDNEYKTWDRFAVKAWPTKFLVDGRGYIRLTRQGEGYYRQFEMSLQRLLRLRQEGLDLPDPLPALRAEDETGALCYRPTPELHAGYGGGGLFGGGLGNPEGYVSDGVMAYSLPPAEERQAGRFYLEGFWRAGKEAMTFVGQDGGKVVVPYRAAGVNAVLSPSSDTVELALGLHAGSPGFVEVRQDGAPLRPERQGKDIASRPGGGAIPVDEPRLYRIVRNPGFEAHELELTIHSSGIALYSLTFETCVAANASELDDGTFVRP